MALGYPQPGLDVGFAGVAAWQGPGGGRPFRVVPVNELGDREGQKENRGDRGREGSTQRNGGPE